MKITIDHESGVTPADVASVNQVLGKSFPNTKVEVAISGTEGRVSESGVCLDACNIAETTAIAACDLVKNPIARELCKAAARLAGEECRKACG